MGSEDLFHKRRGRSRKELKRAKARRDPYDRVLIVCEGEKTEPNYFRELIREYRLNTANVEIDGRCGSSPSSVWRYARKRYDEESAKGDPFDRVYCIIDKDSHHDYQDILNTIRNTGPKGVFHVISSVPCFEYWVLLHFNYVTHPYAATGTHSPCGCLIRELKNYLPEYEKGEVGLYETIKAQTDFAVNNSKRALEEARNNGTDEPTTQIHELVEYLRNLK